MVKDWQTQKEIFTQKALGGFRI